MRVALLLLCVACRGGDALDQPNPPPVWPLDNIRTDAPPHMPTTREQAAEQAVQDAEDAAEQAAAEGAAPVAPEAETPDKDAPQPPTLEAAPGSPADAPVVTTPPTEGADR